ncbi:MAG: acVLRF1 family peptidyl-tRNA hydrolase [Acidothermaceae bacterium]
MPPKPAKQSPTPSPTNGPATRMVDVAPARLAAWVAGFAARHGEFDVRIVGDTATLTAADGSTAALEPPFPPMPAGWADNSREGSVADPIAAIVAHALEPRLIGVLLVRLGGYAAGLFDGGQLTASKVGSRQVHGRSAAGGWSQQRFARRREGQVRVALDAAVEAAVRIIVPALRGPSGLASVVTGGDRQALRTTLADARLAELKPLVARRILDVPDPKARVLRDSYAPAIAIRVTITDAPMVADRS